MFKRRKFIKGLTGLFLVPFLPVVEFVKPKKYRPISGDILRLQWEYTRQMQEAFKPAVDELYRQWIEEEGLQPVLDCPADPEYFKSRMETINIVRSPRGLQSS